ncbi:formate dehydrogenase accessory protein [compost metagenome]
MKRCMVPHETAPDEVGETAEAGEIPATQQSMAVTRWRGGEATAEIDHIAEEVPVALEYNGVSHAVMLATPADLEDFALGFSLSEGIVAAPRDIYGIEVVTRPNGVAVEIEIASEAFVALKARRRALAGRTGCGLCGTESLDEVMRAPHAVQSEASFDPAVLHAAFAQLQRRQALLRDTGATHAAGWLRADGEVSLVREDVGRHNALDKLAGALARSDEDIGRGAVIVTSRASYEMVLKTAAIGAGVLAAVSGPTALAVRLAGTAGVTLAGFVRAGGLVAYAHPHRLRMA